MLSLLLIAVYALVCLAQIAYILGSEPIPTTQQDEPETGEMAWLWLGYPI